MSRRRRILGTSALLVVGLTLSGSYLVNAATPTTTITACQSSKGALRVVSATTKCSSKEKKLTWNVKGPTGATGKTGAPGAAGKTGATGPAGAAGKNGTNGLPGKDGLPGANGKDGVPGLTGPTGPAGADGQDGVDGKDGAAGPAGPAGATGPAGAPGPAGATGPAGPAGGAVEAANPNPHNLTYRMQLGSKSPIVITEFQQKFSVKTSSGAGTGGVREVSNPEVSDLEAILPMTPAVVGFMNSLTAGHSIATARVEACRPGELTGPNGFEDRRVGKCLLQVDLTNVVVTGVAVKQGPAGETATVSLNPATVKVTSAAGTPQAASVSYDRGRATSDASGTARATATGDSPFTTTLTGPRPGVISTDSWSQDMSTGLSAGGGGSNREVSNPDISDLSARTRTGPGTVTLLGALFKREFLPRVEVAGCSTPGCSQSVVLTDAVVTEVVIGSPTLADQTRFNYGTIHWDRSRAVTTGNGTETESFNWDLSNRPR